MSDRDEATTLERVDALIATIPSAAEPYWVAGQVSSAASDALTTSLTACDLYLLWSALEDTYELKPDERPQAVAAMRRAAEEWIAVKGDQTARAQYLDRWLYEIVGYKRDVPKGWKLRVEEVSANSYRVLAEDRSGRTVSALGTDPRKLMAEVGRQAFELDAAG